MQSFNFYNNLIKVVNQFNHLLVKSTNNMLVIDVP